MTFSEEELIKRLDAYRQYGSYTASADALGVSESSMRRVVKKAVRLNLGGDFEGGALPEGYVLGKVTSLVGPNGTVMEWQHKLPEIEAIERTIEHMIEVMGENIKPVEPIPAPPITHEHSLVLYPVVDVHLGLYAWAKESGENYDLTIAREQFLASVSQLIERTPPANTALIVVLGDFFHADNNNAVTERSGNHLDVDGRHDKVLFIGAELIIWMIDMALAKHDYVTVRVSRGNHDPYASKALAMALWFRYQNNPRVTIDRNPADFWSYQWGNTMLSFTHGDNVKAENMPGVMAAQEPKMWGETLYRYAYSGHFHRSKTGPKGDEKDGAIWEILPAFTAKDAWNRSMGHNSLRTIKAMTFDYDKGLRETTTINI